MVFISTAGWLAAISPRLPFAIYGLAAVFLPLMWKVIVDLQRTSPAPGASLEDGSSDPSSWALVFTLLALLQATTNMIFFVMPTQLSFFFAVAGYSSPVMTGSALGVLMLSGGGLALLYGRVQRAIGYVGIFALGYGAMALGFLLLVFAVTPLGWFVAAAAIGAGYALVSPSFVTLALKIAPLRRRGVAGGILTASVFIGQFCSPLLSTPLVAAYGYEGLFYVASSLAATMAVAAVLKACANGLQALKDGVPTMEWRPTAEQGHAPRPNCKECRLMEWSGRAPAPLACKLWGFEPRKEHVSCHGLLSLPPLPPWASIWARTASISSVRMNVAPSCCALSSPVPSSRSAWPTFRRV